MSSDSDAPDHDRYLSTLRAFVAALGGRIELSAVFPDRTIPLTVPTTAGGQEADLAKTADEAV